jgi:tripartite ATP-independent transporter DctP family solute receptor
MPQPPRIRFTVIVLVLAMLSVLPCLPGHLAIAADKVAKLGHVGPTDNPIHIGAEVLAKRVAEQSKGALEIKIFPNGQLGQDRDLTEGVQLGTIQMAVTSNAVMTRYEPRALLLDLPFLFRDDSHWEKVIDGPTGQELRELFLTKGIRILGYFDGAWRGPYARRPIDKFDDMKGLKFRTMESPMHISIYTALGARGVPMSSAEQYPALQQGVVDGGDSPWVWYKQLKHYEVAKHLTDLPLFKLTMPLIVSEKFYASLTPEQQKIVQAAADEATTQQRRVQREIDTRLLDELKKSGVTVHHISAAERERFVKAMASVWKEYEDKVGKGRIEAVLQTK